MSEMDMGGYILRVFPDKESYLCVSPKITLRGNPLFLTGTYLQILKQNGFEFDLKKWFSVKQEGKVFIRLLIDDIEKWLGMIEPVFLNTQTTIMMDSLNVFYKITSGKAKIIDTPVFAKQYLIKELENKNESTEKSIENIANSLRMYLLFETLAFIQVFDTWFNPNYLKSRSECFQQNEIKSSINEMQNIESDIRTHTLAVVCFNTRCRDLRSEPFWDTDTGKMCIQYDSFGILPLCWAEIWQGLQRNLLAGICPYCGKIFLYPLKNYKKNNCGSKECKKEALIARHGGIDGYKEWERERRYWK